MFACVKISTILMVFVICEYKAKKKVTLISHLAYATIVAKARNREKKKRGYCRREAFWAFFFLLF